MVNLAKQTPHRVVRELYEQYIAYGRAYVDSIPTYMPADDVLADVNVSSAIPVGYLQLDRIRVGKPLVGLGPRGALRRKSLALGDPRIPSVSFLHQTRPAPRGFSGGVGLTADTSDWEKRQSQHACRRSGRLSNGRSQPARCTVHLHHASQRHRGRWSTKRQSCARGLRGFGGGLHPRLRRPPVKLRERRQLARLHGTSDL